MKSNLNKNRDRLIEQQNFGKGWELVEWGFHDLVQALRDAIGYQDYIADGNFDDNQEWMTYVNSLDPKEWKDHDLYAILGLKMLRHHASEDQIKNAYRKLILVHHPDKNPEMHDVFICIQRAYSYLSDPVKRKSFDSIDSHNDDEIPTEDAVKSDFYGSLGPVFVRNARWSKRHPVPYLGDDDTPLNRVEAFYDFWFEFDSWREFSLLDQEEVEEGANREQRRYVERLNKAERQAHRKTELARLRRLVELARSHDPRLRRQQEQQRQEKEQRRRERQDAATQRRQQAEEQQRLERESAEQERRIQLEQQQRLDEKRRHDRELIKSRLKRERKTLRQLLQTESFYTAPSPPPINGHAAHAAASVGSVDSADAALTQVRHLQFADLLCTHLDIDSLSQLNLSLADPSLSYAERRALFIDKGQSVEQSILDSSRQLQQKSTEASSDGAGSGANVSSVDTDGGRWTYEMNQFLVKAVNNFPPGSVKRWENIAAYINSHLVEAHVTGKEVLKRVKQLQGGDGNTLRAQANQRAASSVAGAGPDTDMVNDAMRNMKITERCEVAEAIRQWTNDEQKRLEEALRKFPASEEERWEKISDFVGSRTKKECMLRFKQIAELLKSKRSKDPPASVSVKSAVK